MLVWESLLLGTAQRMGKVGSDRRNEPESDQARQYLLSATAHRLGVDKRALGVIRSKFTLGENLRFKCRVGEFPYSV